MIEPIVQISAFIFLNVVWAILMLIPLVCMFYVRSGGYSGYKSDWWIWFIIFIVVAAIGVSVWFVALVDFV